MCLCPGLNLHHNVFLNVACKHVTHEAITGHLDLFLASVRSHSIKFSWQIQKQRPTIGLRNSETDFSAFLVCHTTAHDSLVAPRVIRAMLVFPEFVEPGKALPVATGMRLHLIDIII